MDGSVFRHATLSKTACSPQFAPTAPSRCRSRLRAVFPVVHTLYVLRQRTFIDDRNRSSGRPGNPQADRARATSLLRGLGIVSRGVSTRTTVQILSGILLSAERGKARAGRDGHGGLAAHRGGGEGRDGRLRGRARPAAARACAAAAGGGGHGRAQAGGGSGRDPLRHGELPAAHLQRRGLPAVARDDGHRAARGRPGDGARDRRSRQPLGLARRVAARC